MALAIVNDNLHEKVLEIKKDTGMSIKSIVEVAIEEYISRYEQEKKES